MYCRGVFTGKHLVANMVIGMLMLMQAATSLAQRRFNSGFMPYASVSFGAGSATYLGDLAGYNHLVKSLTTLPRWNIGLGYSRQFTPTFSARVQFSWARIAGDDYSFSQRNPGLFASQYIRNLHFRNDIKELAITGLYNFVADGRTPNRRARFTPYVAGGIALVAHDPEARTPTVANNGEMESQRWVKLQPLHTEGQGLPGYDKAYARLTLAIPLGFGIRYRLNPDFNVGFEIGFRYTFTDYLDDVSGTYAQPNALEGLARQMADRRFEYKAARVNVDRYTTLQQLLQQNPAQFTTPTRGNGGTDGYVLTQLSIQYIFPRQVKCPPLR